MSASDRARIAIVGGGVFAPRLCELLASAPGPALDIVLSARRTDRLAVIARHAARRVGLVRGDHRVVAAETLDRALEGADIVVLLVRIGGFAARSHDEETPTGFGLVGDEGLGVGGLANAWRTLPALARAAEVVRRVAPRAQVVNLVAPLGLTTRLLLERGLDAFGLCELPARTLERVARAAGVSPSGLDFRYGGLNHLGWAWALRAGSRDPIDAAVRAGIADGEVCAQYGALPMHYFYRVFERSAALRLGLRVAPGRARQLARLSEIAFARFESDPGSAVPELDARETPWFDDAVVPVVGSLLGAPAFRGFANVRNESVIGELPRDAVVETAVTFDTRGCHPSSPGPMPPRVAAFTRAVATAEEFLWNAFGRSQPALIADAVRALPLSISAAQVRPLVDFIVASVPTEGGLA